MVRGIAVQHGMDDPVSRVRHFVPTMRPPDAIKEEIHRTQRRFSQILCTHCLATLHPAQSLLLHKIVNEHLFQQWICFFLHFKVSTHQYMISSTEIQTSKNTSHSFGNGNIES